MEKSAEAFRTISEVAEELNVPKHVLRFWEGKFTHIKPMKRGGGRRYYRPEDVELLRGIRQLLHEEGYTIKGVQKQIRQSGIEFIKAYGKGGPELPALSMPPEFAAARASRTRARPAGGRLRSTHSVDSTTAGAGSNQTLALDHILRELQVCRSLLAKLT